MRKIHTYLAGAAGFAAALAVATPAGAQYPYGYPSGSGVVGQIINNVLGYGQYPYGNYGYGQPTYMSSQRAIDQCARATEARLNGGYRGYNYGYDNPYLGGGYGNVYAINGRGRVLGIDRVEVRKYGRLRVTGVATSGRDYSNPWGYGNYQYNRRYGVPDLRFKCNADPSGRVYDVDIYQLRYR